VPSGRRVGHGVIELQIAVPHSVTIRRRSLVQNGLGFRFVYSWPPAIEHFLLFRTQNCNGLTKGSVRQSWTIPHRGWQKRFPETRGRQVTCRILLITSSPCPVETCPLQRVAITWQHSGTPFVAPTLSRHVSFVLRPSPAPRSSQRTSSSIPLRTIRRWRIETTSVRPCSFSASQRTGSVDCHDGHACASFWP
jgi:hypothetical protein